MSTLTPDILFHAPAPLDAEHDELHRELSALLQAPGEVGGAARELARRLHEHFDVEQELAMPLLGLLPALADGVVVPEMARAIEKARRLESALPLMLQEHVAILDALETLAASAQITGRDDVLAFVEKLKLHVRTEEAVLYPAALLIGRYLDCRLGPLARR